MGRRPLLAGTPLPDGKYCFVLTLELKDGKGIELMVDDKPSETPFWIGTLKVETAGFQVGGEAKEPGAKVQAGEETKLFADENWYKQQKGEEQEFTGVLKAIPQNPNEMTTLQRTSLYSLGDRTIYTGAKKVDALDKLVGKKVIIRGKPYDINLEGQRVSEIWPGAVRVDDSKVDSVPATPEPIRPPTGLD